MSRFLLLGDILSLSEAKGTQTRFLGRRGSLLLLMWYTRVLKARVSTNGRKSRDFKIEILSLFLSLSLRKEKGTQKLSLSLFPLSLSLYVFEVSLFRPKKVRFARTNREREREVMIFARGVSSLSLQSVSLSSSWEFVLDFWKSDELFHLNSLSVEKKQRKFFRI